MSEQTIVWDLALIQKYNYSGPRYTSYPTALEFNQCYDEAAFQRAAARYPERPLSLYVHIPFCHKLCYFCGCNKLVTRQTHKADEYLNVLAQEIASRAPLFAGRKVGQMHWGGGTPTYLDKAQISRLVALLRGGRCVWCITWPGSLAVGRIRPSLRVFRGWRSLISGCLRLRPSPNRLSCCRSLLCS